MHIFVVRFGRIAVASVAAAAVVAMNPAVAPLAQADPAGGGGPATMPKAVARAENGKYIVGLTAAPVALYDGSISGLAPTRSTDGATLDRRSAAVAEYRSYLDETRATVLGAVPGVVPIYEYDWAYAGFAAELTYEQAVEVAAQPGVRMVVPDERRELVTSHTPTFLGLDQPGGAWETAGGADVLGGAGEDLVIGSIDTGFTPGSGSFAPLDPAPATPVPDGWLGSCDPGDPDDFGGGEVGGEVGDQPAAIECAADGTVNSKVIGARYYRAGQVSVDEQDFLSPRDYDGHGSHTASTAGGNYGVPATVGGALLGEVTGMAPRARIAVYKVCWSGGGTSGCHSIDNTAAFDQATADGVDVINYSIGGATSTATQPEDLAMLGAAAAGIFIAVSASNNGAPGTVEHNYPWVTTVAASTQDRRYEATATLGNGEAYTGTGIPAGVPETAAVYAGDIPDPDYEGDPADSKYCPIGSLDPVGAAGKIVVCERGLGVARVDKSQAVFRAGGVGMVLTNDEPNGTSTVSERHSVPTVHVSYLDGQEIIAYVTGTPDPTIAISQYVEVVGDAVPAPSMASFSSRGPAGIDDGDLLKPDITAPGVDILAAVAPYAHTSFEEYAFLSGTSMSSPHIAGIAALLKDIHPDWSPMAIKSALMTGAYQTNNQGDPIDLLGAPATPFEYGAGHVDPQAGVAAPLVYDSGSDDWWRYLCGGELADDPICDTIGDPLRASDVNVASIAVGGLAGSQEVTRTVTNPTGATVSATATIESPDGITTTVTPDEITLEPGQSASYVARFERSTAPLDTWAFGAVTWTTTDGVEVRSPTAIEPVSFDAADELAGEGVSGDVTDLTTSGVTGDVTVATTGLDEAQVDAAVLTDPIGGTFPSADPPDPAALPPYLLAAPIEIAADTRLARFQVFPDEYGETTDVDLFLYEGEFPDLTLVGQSAAGGSNEVITVENPAAGPYTVYADLWGLDPSVEEELVSLNTFLVGPGGVGELTATPDFMAVEAGSETPITLSWTGLEEPTELPIRRYLGLVRYRADGDTLAQSVLQVDVTESAPPTTPPPTTAPPTITPPPPTTSPTTLTPTPTGTLPSTGSTNTSTFATLGLAAILLGGAFVAVAARRLREDS